MKNKGLHSKNKFNKGYDFSYLINIYSNLKEYVSENKFGDLSIDFSNPKAVKALNKALLFTYNEVSFWEFPDENLCPPIPGRLDYILHLSDLLSEEKDIKILDIGTGATCIYPLLGVAEFNWNFVATDISQNSLIAAKKIIARNKLNNKISLRYQKEASQILNGVIEKGDSFTATMCNPPFYSSVEEAKGANKRKSRNVGNNVVRNFSGNTNELCYKGGEKAFLHNYLFESSLHSSSSKWFTCLVSKKDNIVSLEKSSKKLGVKDFEIIPMNQGNKVTRIICWRF